MRFLALDTSSDACTVALSIDGQVREEHEVTERGHTARLLPMLHALLAEGGCVFSQLDGIACGVGPGSFAGLRIGVGFVKGLCMGLDRPVVPVSSLAALAQRVVRLGGAGRALVAVDARLNEIYWGAYRAGPDGRAVAEVPDAVCAPQAARAPNPGPWHAVGTGWGVYRDALRGGSAAELIAEDAVALPHAEDLLLWALPELRAGGGVNADELVPVYLRDSVALKLADQARLREQRRM